MVSTDWIIWGSSKRPNIFAFRAVAVDQIRLHLPDDLQQRLDAGNHRVLGSTSMGMPACLVSSAKGPSIKHTSFTR